MKFFRSAMTLLLFAAFALGGVVLSFFVLPFVRNRRCAHRIVRRVWRALIALVQWTRLVSVDASMLKSCKGRIIVANHPSLIDVVILTAFIPDVFSIAKNELKETLHRPARIATANLLANAPPHRATVFLGKLIESPTTFSIIRAIVESPAPAIKRFLGNVSSFVHTECPDFVGR